MKKIIISLIAFLIICLIAIGVLSNKEKDNELKDIVVAEVAHSIFYAPMYVADSLGYFEEEGIDADIILTSGADAVAASVMILKICAFISCNRKVKQALDLKCRLNGIVLSHIGIRAHISFHKRCRGAKLL